MDHPNTCNKDRGVIKYKHIKCFDRISLSIFLRFVLFVVSIDEFKKPKKKKLFYIYFRLFVIITNIIQKYPDIKNISINLFILFFPSIISGIYLNHIVCF